MPAHAVVAGWVREAQPEPGERFARPDLDRGRDLDRRRLLGPAGTASHKPDGPVVAGDDVERATHGTRPGGAHDPDRRPPDEAVLGGRPVVVRVAEVAAVNEPA